MIAQKFSMKDFEVCYSKFIAAKDTANPQKFSQTLDQLGRMLVWGQRQDRDFFEYFCEVRGLDILLETFSRSKSKQIVIAIIGFFNMLFTNLNKIENINFLLSHPCVISLQNIKFVALDNQIAQYYINFLKQLSRKLNNQTMHLFFNKRYSTFPLLMQTTRFYNHPENLVRTTCLNILLTCSKLNHPKMKQFVAGFPFVVYYINECNFLKQYWYIMDSIINSEGDNHFELQNLQTILQDHEQLLYFIEDYMHIDPIHITKRLIDAFSNECMSFLLQSLYSHKKVHFSINVALFICNILIKVVTNKTFADFIIFSLFGKYYPAALSVKLMHPMEHPLSYSKQWKFKGFWDSHQTEVSQYCLKNYFNCQKPKDIISTDLNQRKRYSSEVKSIFGMGTNFFDREAEKLQHIFAIPIKSPPQDFKRKASSTLFQELLTDLKQDKLDLTDCQQNPVRALIFSFAKSKDDRLVFLTLNLLNEVVNKKNVSQQIFEFCSLSPSPKTIDFKSISDIQQIIKSCLHVFETDPPQFRICTYKLAQNLIQTFSPIYSGQINKIPQQLLEMAREALRNAIERIKIYIYQQKDWENSLNLFNLVSEQDSIKRKKTLVTYGFSHQPKKQEKIQNIYECFPRNKTQIQARDFWLYNIIRDTYCFFTKTNCKFEVNLCDEKHSKKASNFKIGQVYQIEEDHCIDCKCRVLHDQFSTKCSLILLGGYVVVGEQGRVKFKASYQDCLMITDRSDPRNLMLDIKDTILVLGFENAKQAYDIKKRFQQMKSLILQYQLSMLVKQTEWMLERVNQD